MYDVHNHCSISIFHTQSTIVLCCVSYVDYIITRHNNDVSNRSRFNTMHSPCRWNSDSLAEVVVFQRCSFAAFRRCRDFRVLVLSCVSQNPTFSSTMIVSALWRQRVCSLSDCPQMSMVSSSVAAICSLYFECSW